MWRVVHLFILAIIISIRVFGFAEDRVINGSPVVKTDSIYWSVVRIIERRADGLWIPHCTGVIYSKNIILTAAHCLDDKQSENLRIAFEAQPFTIEQQEYESTSIDPLTAFNTSRILSYEVHPGYSLAKKENDVAVIRTENNHPDGFKAFSLLSSEAAKKLAHGKEHVYTIAGYGLFAANPVAESEVLRKTNVIGTIKDQLIYVDQKSGTGGCFGDSGGPALIRLDSKIYLAGLTQGGVGTSPYCDQLGTWTYIPNVLTYIMAAVSRLNLK